jgi:hypothetical protein
MVQADRNAIFVFGDNMKRAGYGGQAGQMRGEPNTIGVPTNGRQSEASRHFLRMRIGLTPKYRAISDAFRLMGDCLSVGRNVVIPSDGLGTGLAELPTRAPKLHAIEAAIEGLDE